MLASPCFAGQIRPTAGAVSDGLASPFRLPRPNREFIEFRFQARFDEVPRTRLPGMAQILVAGHVRITIKNPDRDGVEDGADLARTIYVGRVVRLQVFIDLGEVRADLD